MRRYEDFLMPKKVEVCGKEFHIGTFSASDGRHIVPTYLSSLFKAIVMHNPSSYEISEKMMLKIMGYVAIEATPDNYIVLSTQSIIDSTMSKLCSETVKPWQAQGLLEWEVMKYNCTFFQDVRNLTFLKDFAQTLQQSDIPTSMDSLGQLFQKGKQHFTNSEPSTL